MGQYRHGMNGLKATGLKVDLYQFEKSCCSTVANGTRPRVYRMFYFGAPLKLHPVEMFHF
jgi:hypothetical protein